MSLQFNSSTKLFHEKLSMLNDNLISFLQKEHAKKPHADLTPTLNDYFKHLRSLDEMYSTPVDAGISTKPSQSTTGQISLFPEKTKESIIVTSAEATMVTSSLTTTTTITTTTSVASPFTLGPLTTKPALFGGFTSTVENGKDKATNVLPTFSIPTFPTPITSTFNLTTIPHTTINSSLSSIVDSSTKRSLKRSADTSSDEIFKKQLFSGHSGQNVPTSLNKFAPLINLSSEKTSAVEPTIITTSLITTTTTTSVATSVAVPTFSFGSLASKQALFGGIPSFSSSSTNETGLKDNNATSINKFPSLPPSSTSSTFPFPFGKTTAEATIITTTSLITTTTSTSSVPTFNFGSLASKPALFNGFSSFSTSTNETGKDNAANNSVNKFPPLPSLFSFEKSSGESTTTTSSAPTFTFGTSAIKPSLFGGFTSTVENGKDNDNENDNENDDKPEEFIPKDNFQPIVPLPSKVETKSGEENEENLFEARCRLFRFDKEAKEYRGRGTGDIKILHNKQLNRYRCVARNNEALSKLLANFTIFANFKVEKKGEKPTCLIWRCKDCSENKEGTDETFLAKFRDEETAQKFIKKVEEIISILK